MKDKGILTWPTLDVTYKINLGKLMYKIYNKLLPETISDIIEKGISDKKSRLRNKHHLSVPNFNTYFTRNSFARRGEKVFNTLLRECNVNSVPMKEFVSTTRKSKELLDLDFNSISPQTVYLKDLDLNIFEFFLILHVYIIGY